jgi:integrase
VILRIGGINKVISKGKVYYYHRKTGERVAAEYGTVAFLQEVERLNLKHAGKNPTALPGTLGALIAAYKTDANPEWKNLKPDTRIWYQRIFNYLKPLDGVLLADLDTPFLTALRDKCFVKHKGRFTNGVISCLSMMFKWSKPRGWMTTNPAADVPKVRKKKGEKKKRRAWLPEEVPAVFESFSGGMLVGITLGYWCGLTLKDFVEFPRKLDPLGNGYDPVKRTLTYDRSKTNVGTTVPVSDAAAAILDAEIARLKDAKIIPTTMVINTSNEPFTRNGFKANFYKGTRKLVAAGKVHPGVTLHGLRHTMGKDIIDADGDAKGVAAALAQETSQMGELYSKERDKSRLAKKAVSAAIEAREARAKA